MDYKRLTEEEAPQALRLARWINRRFAPRSIIDLGCATGIYLAPFVSYRPLRLLGADYSQEAVNAARDRLPKVPVYQADLTKPAVLGAERFDIGLCIEVAEHMPVGSEDALLDNVTTYCRTVIFSAAQPGQGGDGHINCRPREYWVDKLWKHRLFFDRAETDDMQKYMFSGYHMGWFRNAFVATGEY